MFNFIGLRRFTIPFNTLIRFYPLFSEIMKTTTRNGPLHFGLPRKLKIAVFTTLSGVSIMISTEIKLKEKLKEADDLFDQNMCDEVVRLLEPLTDIKDADVLWRLCRAKYTLAKDIADRQMKKNVIDEADGLIKEAISLNEASYQVHKWMAILIEAKSAYCSLKEKIMQAYEIKKHMLRALELNPKDATVHHLLGCWCFEVAALPWYQRKIANTIFAAPPNSSFEEALQHFLRAEEVDPQFYSMNYLMLGKTYLRLNDREKATFYLKLACEYPQKTTDDAKAKEEAASILKNI
ncbi:hypothetical protein J437_LFUL012037 [Ladona fulva]|uniref:Regulator of microtubule dynamics protein 1 n=1 Tax=Ladona fulva TaxID=123851 RepID=A0A8K0P3I0_LADFU|nr:hypothetical protein J437_LFUL012037 [Ladona fulva]